MQLGWVRIIYKNSLLIVNQQTVLNILELYWQFDCKNCMLLG